MKRLNKVIQDVKQRVSPQPQPSSGQTSAAIPSVYPMPSMYQTQENTSENQVNMANQPVYPMPLTYQILETNPLNQSISVDGNNQEWPPAPPESNQTNMASILENQANSMKPVYPIVEDIINQFISVNVNNQQEMPSNNNSEINTSSSISSNQQYPSTGVTSTFGIFTSNLIFLPFWFWFWFEFELILIFGFESKF